MRRRDRAIVVRLAWAREDRPGQDNRAVASLRVRQILFEVLAFDQPDPGPGGATVWTRLCASAISAVPITGAGVALMSARGHGGTLAATDGPAAVLEDLQQTLGEGPCLNAYHDRRPVLLPDLTEETTRWPGFTPAALEAGVAAIFAFPLQIGAIRLGVLDLYRATPGPLEDLQLKEALDYAAAASSILLDLQHSTSPGDLHPDFVDAADGDRQIHQATGIVTVQASVGLDEALLLLRARAYADGRRLRELAADVVAHRVTFYPGNEHDE